MLRRVCGRAGGLYYFLLGRSVKSMATAASEGEIDLKKIGRNLVQNVTTKEVQSSTYLVCVWGIMIVCVSSPLPWRRSGETGLL